VLVADDPEQQGYVRVLGPQRDGPMRRVRSESLLGLVERTLSVKRLEAVRLLAEELDRLDTERIAGLKVRELGTEHLYGSRLPASPRWPKLLETVDGANRAGWRELLNDLGYAIEPLKPAGYLAKAGGHSAEVSGFNARIRPTRQCATRPVGNSLRALRGLVQDGAVAASGLRLVEGGVGGEQRVVVRLRARVEERATDADGGENPVGTGGV
jgi:hypothetical protein